MKLVANMQSIWDLIANKIRHDAGWVEGGYQTDPTMTVDWEATVPFLDPEKYADRGFLLHPNLVLPMQYDAVVKNGVPFVVDLGLRLEDIPAGVYVEIMMRPEFAEQKGIYLRGGNKIIDPAATENWSVVVMYDGAGMPHSAIESPANIAWRSDGRLISEHFNLERGSCPFIAVLRPVISVSIPATPIPQPIEPVEDTPVQQPDPADEAPVELPPTE